MKRAQSEKMLIYLSWVRASNKSSGRQAKPSTCEIFSVTIGTAGDAEAVSAAGIATGVSEAGGAEEAVGTGTSQLGYSTNALHIQWNETTLCCAHPLRWHSALQKKTALQREHLKFETLESFVHLHKVKFQIF